MGKTITDEIMKLSIIIEGDSAQQQLFKLEKATRKLNEENASLRLEKQRLEKQGKQESARYKEITEIMKANSKAIAENKSRMAELQKEIGLTGLTMSQLNSKATMLRNTLRNLIPGSQDYARYNAELKEVNARIAELNGKARTAKNTLGSFADSYNRYAALGASFIALLTGIVLSVQKVIDWNGKLADAQSNVQKTTGMTKAEVDALTKSFGLFQTRTSRIDLLGIAEVGGRIGIAKDEIADFVKVMDKASVALGDSFEGGPEEVADKLGKIKGLYEEIKNVKVEVAFNAVGSAINDLGADGNATEANIAAFVTRVGSLPDALKPSIAQALGLGAAFEESGLQAELAGNNYGKVISIASRDFPKFAKVMNVSEKSVKDLLNTDPNEFFLQFAQSLKGLDATDLAQVLDYLKLNDNEVKMVLGAASKNIDLFRDKIDLAGKSMNEATSLTNEFDIKNNNLAATLEKLKKKVIAAFSSETIVNWLASTVEWFAKLVGATDDVDGSGRKWRNTLVFIAKSIAVVTAALVTNVAWQKLVVLWTARNTQGQLLYNLAVKARAVSEGIAIVATQLWAGTTMLLTGNIKGATQALRIMTATMKTTPWGLLLSLVAAVGVAYVAFSESASKAAQVEKTLAEVHLEATQSIAKERNELDMLVKVAKDETKQKGTREKAIKRLNEIIPDYIGTLTLENLKMMEGTNILKKYTDELYKNARAKAAQSKFEELAKQQLEVENRTSRAYESGFGSFMSRITGQGNNPERDNIKTRRDVEAYVLKTFFPNARKDKTTGLTMVDKENWDRLVAQYVKAFGIDEKEAELATIKAQMEALEGDLLKATVEDLEKPKEEKKNVNIPVDEKKKKYNDSYLKDEEKFADDLLKLRRKTEEDRLALMQDGYEKEMEQERINHKYKLLELQNEIIDKQKLEKIDKQIAEAQKAGDSPKVKALESIRKMMLEKNKEINDQIELEEKLHLVRMSTIEEKGASDKIKKDQEAYEKAKVLRQTEFNNELNSITTLAQAREILRKKLSIRQLAKIKTLEEAKEALQKEFNKREIDEETKHLNNLLAKFDIIVKKGQLDQIDLSLLTPKQVEDFTAEAAKIGLTLSELIAKKNELLGKQNSETNAQALGISQKTDILGFSADNWQVFYDNLAAGKFGIEEMIFAVSALTEMWGKYNQFVTANEQAQLRKFEQSSDAKKRRLKQQLDNGYINQVQYKRGIDALDKDLEKRKADLSYRQAKREKGIAIASAISGTAMAVVGALGNKPWTPFNFALAGLVGAMGALQLGTILATPLPAKGYEEGLYPEFVKREQDGKTFKASFGGNTKSGMVKKPTYFLAGEGNKPEMVIDNKAWTKMNPDLKDSLIRELRGIKGFENGYYKDGLLYTGPENPKPETPSGSNDELLMMMLKVISENTELMRDIKETGLTAIVSSKDYKSIKEMRDALKRLDDNRKKSQV